MDEVEEDEEVKDESDSESAELKSEDATDSVFNVDEEGEGRGSLEKVDVVTVSSLTKDSFSLSFSGEKWPEPPISPAAVSETVLFLRPFCAKSVGSPMPMHRATQAAQAIKEVIFCRF